VWAPELHKLDNGHWYIYFTASPNPHSKGEVGHGIFVLKSQTSDPLGEYDLFGPLETGNGPDGKSPNIWAIDLTTFQLHGKRYAVWSGWDVPSTRQFLYIAKMESPTKILGPRVQLCHNEDYEWERIHSTSHGLNEAPQVFQSDTTTCIFYSCGVSCRVTYKLGMLQYHGGNPLDPQSWVKQRKPPFDGTESVYGVGHSCLVQSMDGKEWWHIFHAKQDKEYGWRRAIHAQQITLDHLGYPVLGQPIDKEILLDRPSGETLEMIKLPISLPFDTVDRCPWTYYGHQQFMHWSHDGLHLGRIPVNPTNAFRSGEKLVLGAVCPNDLTAVATFKFVREYDGNAGILVRCTVPAVGYHALRGYYVGLDPMARAILIGKMNGTRYTELGRRENVTINVMEFQQLAVTVTASRVDVFLNGDKQLSINDTTYGSGSIGIRVCDTHALFTKFEIT
jgi:GH43 family beta-xylosidase